MSNETADNKAVNETEAPVEAVSTFNPTNQEPLSIIVPSGALNTQTNSSLNWFYPFLPQTGNAVISGTTFVYNITSSGYASVNNGGLVFQNGQYNSKREGGGQ